MGPRVPAAPPARDECPRYAASSLEPGDFRVVSDRGLQLPHDGHPGSRRARAVETSAFHHRQETEAGRQLSSPAGTNRGAGIAARAGMGAKQLAKLLRALTFRLRPARGD